MWWEGYINLGPDADTAPLMLGKEMYCKTVNLVAKFDPHRNCPEPGRENATCWVNRSFDREWYSMPNEEDEWTQRCPIEPVERMEFEE